MKPAPVIADKYWIVNFTLMDHIFEVILFFSPSEHLQIKTSYLKPGQPSLELTHSKSPITLQLGVFRCHSLFDFPKDTAVTHTALYLN